jgi:hypothetical protein
MVGLPQWPVFVPEEMVYLPLPGFERVRWENIFVEKGARIKWFNDWLSFPYIVKNHSGAKNIRNNFFGVFTIFS